jgi:hypothetical protein
VVHEAGEVFDAVNGDGEMRREMMAKEESECRGGPTTMARTANGKKCVGLLKLWQSVAGI